VTDPVVSLRLDPTSAEIPVRTPQPYTAQGTTAAGRTVNVTNQVALSIDPGGRCPDARCTPAEVGDHRVTATLDQPGRDQLRATATLRVTDPVVSLRLDPTSAEIPVRTPQPYTAQGTTAAGRKVNVTNQTGFTITAPGKCSQAPGKVSCTASQVGDYTVTGTLTQKGRDPITATAPLTVVPGPPTKLKLAPPKAEIPAGAKQPYTAVTEDQFGNETDVTGQTDFRIDKGGSCDGASCSATKVDVYTVTATLKDPGLSATATLTVVPGPPKSLELAPPTKEIQAGVEQTYTAVTKDQHGNKTDVTAQTSLSINPPSSCAIAGTKVSCTKTGSYTVTGTLRDHRPPLSGTATLTVVPGPATTLRLDPGKAEIQAGVEQPYTAIGVDQHGNETDFTSQTGFTITAPGKCSQAPGKVSCTASEIGDYTVTATLDQPGRDQLTAKAALHVVPRPTSPPVISSVQPGFTFAGMSVEVGGNTGSCSRAGTLTFHGNTGDVSANVTADRQGNFVARVTIPKGTFPRVYKLELTVDCNGQLQRAQGDLSVLNIAPTAANDSANAIQDTPVSIPVTDNDRNPDPDTGYPTLVLVSSTPSHGTAEAQTDQSILYTPEQGFIGQDRFQYNLCDDIINAAGTADCSAATVTVTVTDANACLPSPGNISSIKVNPSKGPGGKTLGITATVDRKLAACPFRLLLGGTPLGPDVQVGPDGTIATERAVPKDAKPGPSPIRLATLRAQTLAETPFEVVSPGLSLLLKLLIGAGALLAGALARIAFRRFRRWRTSQEQRRQRRLSELPEDFRVKPHTRPVEVAVEPEHDTTRTFTVRLEPHPDPGNQTVQEMTP
jgi:hypothetical protein